MMRHGDWFFGGSTELSMTQVCIRDENIQSLLGSATVNMQGHQIGTRNEEEMRDSLGVKVARK